MIKVANQIKTRGTEQMTQINITLETELLHELFTKDGRDDAFSKLLETILNQVLMEQSSEQRHRPITTQVTHQRMIWQRSQQYRQQSRPKRSQRIRHRSQAEAPWRWWICFWWSALRESHWHWWSRTSERKMRDKVAKRKHGWRPASVVVAIAASIALLLTEDMSAPMIITVASNPSNRDRKQFKDAAGDRS